jgi:hypothetical protein
MHLARTEQARMLDCVAVTDNGVKRPVDVVQRSVDAEFVTLVSSHCISSDGALVRARSVLLTPGAARLYEAESNIKDGGNGLPLKYSALPQKCGYNRRIKAKPLLFAICCFISGKILMFLEAEKKKLHFMDEKTRLHGVFDERSRQIIKVRHKLGLSSLFSTIWCDSEYAPIMGRGAWKP